MNNAGTAMDPSAGEPSARQGEQGEAMRSTMGMCLKGVGQGNLHLFPRDNSGCRGLRLAVEGLSLHARLSSESDFLHYATA